jgi:hypothetical protein
MARTIKLNQIGDYVQDQMEQLLRTTVLKTDELASSKKSG